MVGRGTGKDDCIWTSQHRCEIRQRTCGVRCNTGRARGNACKCSGHGGRTCAANWGCVRNATQDHGLACCHVGKGDGGGFGGAARAGAGDDEVFFSRIDGDHVGGGGHGRHTGGVERHEVGTTAGDVKRLHVADVWTVVDVHHVQHQVRSRGRKGQGVVTASTVDHRIGRVVGTLVRPCCTHIRDGQSHAGRQQHSGRAVADGVIQGVAAVLHCRATVVDDGLWCGGNPVAGQGHGVAHATVYFEHVGGVGQVKHVGCGEHQVLSAVACEVNFFNARDLRVEQVKVHRGIACLDGQDVVVTTATVHDGIGGVEQDPVVAVSRQNGVRACATKNGVAQRRAGDEVAPCTANDVFQIAQGVGAGLVAVGCAGVQIDHSAW